MPERLNQRETAARLGLTTRQVKNLVDAGMPTESVDGKVAYPWPDTMRWYLDWKVAKAVEAVTPDDAEEAKRRLTTAQARKAEMEVEELEGRLVAVPDVEREVGKMLDGLRASLLAFTAKHGHTLIGCKTRAEVTAKLEPAIHELMRVLSSSEED